MSDRNRNDTLAYANRNAAAELVEDGVELPGPVPAGLAAGVSLPHQIALLAIWPFLEQILNFLVVFVDTALAGHLTKEAANAVGTASYVIWLMNLMVGAISIGATALMARAAGAGRWHRANAVLGQALTMAAGWGVLLGILLYLGAPAISAVSGLKGESLELCILYLRVLAVGMPFSTFLSISAACLRGSGDTRTPFLVMIIVNIVNATISVLLAAPSSPWGTYGIKGIAIGTVSAYAVGFICILALLIKGRRRLRLQPRNLKLRGRIPRRLIRVGLPSFAENSGQWLGNYIVIYMVGRLSFDAAMGAHHITVRIEAFSFMPGFALGLAAATVAGQYLGVNDPKTARRAVWWCYAYGGAVMSFLGMLFILIPEQFVRLVTNQPEFLAACPPLLALAGWAQPGFAACMIFSQAMRGAGDTRTALILTYASTFLVRLPLVYVLAVVYDYGLTGVWIGLCSELLFRGLLFLIAFMKGNWAKVKV